ncbi:hypothetical protein B0H17DRAFT_1142835 [Mycena rosella]|uniref:Uncharacterized protein n=1 Tax=Mycena rosella TaxID=1033263 RepID=A0AAD7D0B7_MYCRO|nr:hypothetical protein B0H17DRAFT_1142835 [Mycena rosella]
MDGLKSEEEDERRPSPLGESPRVFALLNGGLKPLSISKYSPQSVWPKDEVEMGVYRWCELGFRNDLISQRNLLQVELPGDRITPREQKVKSAMHGVSNTAPGCCVSKRTASLGAVLPTHQKGFMQIPPFLSLLKMRGTPTTTPAVVARSHGLNPWVWYSQHTAKVYANPDPQQPAFRSGLLVSFVRFRIVVFMGHKVHMSMGNPSDPDSITSCILREVRQPQRVPEITMKLSVEVQELMGNVGSAIELVLEQGGFEHLLLMEEATRTETPESWSQTPGMGMQPSVKGNGPLFRTLLSFHVMEVGYPQRHGTTWPLATPGVGGKPVTTDESTSETAWSVSGPLSYNPSPSF